MPNVPDDQASVQSQRWRGDLSGRPSRPRVPLEQARARHRDPRCAGTYQSDLIRSDFGGEVCVPDLDKLAREVIRSA